MWLSIIIGTVILLSAAGGFIIGLLFCANQITTWKIRWIAHEYVLAKLQDRYPERIEDFEKRIQKEGS